MSRLASGVFRTAITLLMQTHPQMILHPCKTTAADIQVFHRETAHSVRIRIRIPAYKQQRSLYPPSRNTSISS